MNLNFDQMANKCRCIEFNRNFICNLCVNKLDNLCWQLILFEFENCIFDVCIARGDFLKTNKPKPLFFQKSLLESTPGVWKRGFLGHTRSWDTVKAGFFPYQENMHSMSVQYVNDPEIWRNILAGKIGLKCRYFPLAQLPNVPQLHRV